MHQPVVLHIGKARDAFYHWICSDQNYKPLILSSPSGFHARRLLLANVIVIDTLFVCSASAGPEDVLHMLNSLRASQEQKVKLVLARNGGKFNSFNLDIVDTVIDIPLPDFGQELVLWRENDFQPKIANCVFEGSIEIYRSLQDRLERICKNFGIDKREFDVLVYIAQEDNVGRRVDLKTLSIFTGIPMTTAHRIAERLSDIGLISKIKCGEDRRRLNFNVSTLGYELLKQVFG